LSCWWSDGLFMFVHMINHDELWIMYKNSVVWWYVWNYSFIMQVFDHDHAPHKKTEGAISIQASSRELEEGRCVELFPGHLRSQIQEPEPGPRFGYDGHPGMDKCWTKL
jgi:hypothetical protein